MNGLKSMTDTHKLNLIRILLEEAGICKDGEYVILCMEENAYEQMMRALVDDSISNEKG